MIGADVRGSNTMLVAPVTLSDESTTATGTIVTKNVPPEGMAVGRARQENKPGFAMTDAAKSSSQTRQTRPRSAENVLNGIPGRHEGAHPVEALKRLEYRGCDSAGIATLNAGVLDRRRAVGNRLIYRTCWCMNHWQGKSGIDTPAGRLHGELPT
jgi:hypothetical protein